MWMTWMKACHITAVNTDNLQDYVNKLFDEHKPGTASEYWKCVRRFLSWLERTERIKRSPHTAIRKPTVRHEQTVNPITREDYIKLREAAAGHWMDWVIMLGWNTGMSLADCMLLKWSNINTDRCFIRINRIKTGTEAVIPFDPNDELGRAIIARQQDDPDADPESFVCQDAGSRANIASEAVSANGRAAFRYIAAKAGVVGKSFHSLRHSFVSMLANSGMSTVMATKVSGHTDPKVFARYVHVDTEALRIGVINARASSGNMEEIMVESHGQNVRQIKSYIWRPNTTYIVKRGRLFLPDGTPVEFVRTGEKAEGKRAVVTACDESGDPVSDMRLVVDITDVRRFS
jgi:integrase